MITQETLIWVVGKGWVQPGDLTPGDPVYTLDGLEQTTDIVSAVSSEFVKDRINCIDSGAHNVDVSDDARLLYLSEEFGLKYISWAQIVTHTPNKEFSPKKYLPVLSYPNFGSRSKSDAELERIARLVAIRNYDKAVLDDTLDGASSEDAQVLIDMLEFWCSEPPGKGWFGRVSVKSRSHPILDKYYLDRLSVVAVLAGYTAATTEFSPFKYALKVSYEPTPIPGSRPKNEKFFKKFYAGLMYNIDAGNKPILGKSRGRCFYLPTTSILQKGED